MKQKVGFIGLGIMGSAMAANIARSGYPLIVYNRTVDSTAKWGELGARVALSPRALAEASQVIVAMVTGPEALDDLLWGDEGAGLALDETKVLVNMSTVPPRYTRELEKELADLGVPLIDAPVSGSKKPAQEGTLLILASGDGKLVEELTPLFECMGKKVLYCGKTGQGSTMKMAVNLLVAIMMEGLAEALNFGKLGGLSTENLLEAILSGPMGCALFHMKADMLRGEDFSPHFPLKHMAKDLKFAVDTAFETGSPVPAGHTMLDLYRLGVGQKWGDLDFAAIMKVLEHLNPVP